MAGWPAATVGTVRLSMKNIVILISGSGSNMEAIIEASRRDRWESTLGARIAGVISNKASATGLQRAAELGVATQVVDHQAYASREDFDAALATTVDGFDPQGQPALVVLAGFMRVLTPAFVQRYAGRLVNIHPSLLPAFPGLHTHRRAIEAGCRFVGATVHQVTAELDHGPILAQAVVPVLPGDTAEALATRVLAQEHLLYPRAIAELLLNK